ncbi:MAG: CPBP family intramembrane metalloprotease [Deltaproteobacteria bacterium]|nr:CPBP family intramembrane metalloprotease [Deltaproteobacteria bacterium]
MEANQVETRTLITSLAIIVSIELAMRLVLPKHALDSMVVLGVARTLQVGLIILCLVTWGQGVSCIGLAPSKIVAGFKKGLIWSAGFGILVLFASAVLYMAGINMLALIHARLPKEPSTIALFFLIGGIVGPIAEEVFFRGILYGFLRRWGVLVALTFSTLLFVLAHSISHGVFIPQVVGGILFAVAYEVEGSLLVPITIHTLGNIAIFTLSLII